MLDKREHAAARVRFPIAPRPGPLAADMHREASLGPVAPFVPRALRRLAKQRLRPRVR